MSRHVLVVEDEMLVLLDLTESVESDPGLRCTGCSSVTEAVAVLTADPPDILITDLYLDGRSGLDLVTAVENAGLMIPVIIFTGHPFVCAPNLSNCLELTVLEKPVQTTTLLNQIHRRLQAAHARPIARNSDSIR